MDDKDLIKDNLIARWLDDQLNDDEKNQLDKSGELDNLKIVLDDIDTWKLPKFDTEKGLEDLNKRKKATTTHVKHLNISRWIGIAASILIVITSGYFSWNHFVNQPTSIITNVAENKTITLPKGSIIQLDALSKISYKEKDWEKNRTIQLTGQAFFDVTKGSFKVITDRGSIQVLGTQFNVNTNSNGFTVDCYEGKVKVNYKTKEAILTKGQSAYIKGKNLVKGIHSLEVPEWTLGFRKYNQAMLLEIVKDIEKNYNTKIVLPNKYKNLEFTGKVTLTDLEIALQNLFAPMEIKYRLVDDKVIIE